MEYMSSSILLGYVAKAFGIKGGVFVKLLNEESDTLSCLKSVELRFLRSSARTLTISSIMDGGRIFFEDIHDRTDAEALKGAEIWVDRALLPPTQEDEYYLFDLMGARIKDIHDNWVGEVTGFSSNNAQVLLEIKTKEGHKASIPSIKPIINKIDYQQKIITIDPPSGLLDLAE